jgi:hypothetical protein
MDEPPLSPDFLEQRLKLWLRLAESLDQARAALLQGDVVLFEQSTQAESSCCDQLVGLGRLHRLEQGPAAEARVLLEEIRRTQLRVRHLNRVHAALLRRASRSLQILRNLIAAPGVPYRASAAPDGNYPASKG